MFESYVILSITKTRTLSGARNLLFESYILSITKTTGLSISVTLPFESYVIPSITKTYSGTDNKQK